MSKITEYTAAARFDSGDVLLKDGTNGTKTIAVSDAAVELAGLISSVNHRNIYRGKSLGSTITDDQKTAISSGTFDDLFIGDYWTIGDIVYRIADMDYWLQVGDSKTVTKHHLVIVPDSMGITASMNSSGTAEGGYALSEMRTTTLPTVIETIESAFGDMLLTFTTYLINAVTDNFPSGASLYDVSVELMSEVMVYGTTIMASINHGSQALINRTSEMTQLALFTLNPRIIHLRSAYWLRDVVSNTQFASMSGRGFADYGAASNTAGVRPVFGIIAD